MDEVVATLMVVTLFFSPFFLAFVLPPAWPTNFYVEPYEEQYTCTLRVGKGHDVQMSRPAPIEDALAVCNQLNETMDGKWRWAKK